MRSQLSGWYFKDPIAWLTLLHRNAPRTASAALLAIYRFGLPRDHPLYFPPGGQVSQMHNPQPPRKSRGYR